MAQKDPNTVAQRWNQRLSTAATDGTIAAGIDAVTVSPGVAASRAADLWVQNTTAAKPRFQANSAKVQLADWQNAAKSKGINRIPEGANQAQNKMASVMQSLLPAIYQIKGTLPPRGSFAQNMQRAQQMASQLHDKKGSFKA